MAEAELFGRSINIGSDHVPEQYCDVCFEVHDVVKPVAGYCQNCDQDLCFDCFSTHLRRKPFRNHKLVDKSTRPKTKPAQQAAPQNLSEQCHLHQGERLLSFCHGHNQCCCKVCLTINHRACRTDKISKLAQNTQGSQELKTLNQKLSSLKKGFQGTLSKTGANETVIQRNHSDALNSMKKLRDEFDKLMTETEAQADKVKEEDFQTIEKVSTTCGIVVEQINKLTINLDTLNKNGEAESLFISMKRAESQLKPLEENLDQLDKDNTVREYKFGPNEKLKSLFNDLKVLGKLSFGISPTVGFPPQSTLGFPTQPTFGLYIPPKPTVGFPTQYTLGFPTQPTFGLYIPPIPTVGFPPQSTVGLPQQSKATSLSKQKDKKPIYVKDITVATASDKAFTINGSVLLPNKQILITDWENRKLKLIDTNQDNILSELKLSGKPWDITKVTDDEVAVTVNNPNKIQFVSVFQHSLSEGREMSVNGICSGIAYNDKDQTLIVTYIEPGKIEILDMSGNVMKTFDKDSKGEQLFSRPGYVALTPDMTEVYITDWRKDSVTLMTINGDIKAVYKDSSLQGPQGICVHSSGLVYVVSAYPKTILQLDQVSGEFKLLLGQKDGLSGYPRSISYCESEDKMCIGMQSASVIKVYEMK